MEYKILNNRVYIQFDNNTGLEFDLYELREKIENIPTGYMSSEEKNELIQRLKEDNIL